MTAIWVAALILLAGVAPPAGGEGRYPTPLPPVLDELRAHHHRNDWLHVVTDSMSWEVRVQEVGDESLNGVRVRRSARRAPDHVEWSRISRIGKRESRFHYGQVAGLLIGVAAAAAAMEKNFAHKDPTLEIAAGGLLGLWLGGRFGDGIVYERTIYEARPLDVPDSAFAPDSMATSARAAARVPVDPISWAIWLAPQLSLSSPVGSFDPAGAGLNSGIAFEWAFIPPHFPIGLRCGFDHTSYRTRHDGLTAPVFGSGWAVPLLTVTTRTDTDWLMAGPQWDRTPHATSVFFYSTVGVVRVKSAGRAPWGTGPLGASLTYDMPGVPPDRIGFAGSAGAGARLVFGRAKNLAIVSEVDYRRAAATDYIGAPGVEGSPDTRFSARHGAIELLSARLGLAASWDRRQGTFH